MQSERLIIIGGVAHSGTTILTYLLRQHPGIICITNGGQKNLLENDYLPAENGDAINSILEEHKDKRILLKRPWNYVWHGNWMAKEMPEARYLYSQRDFKDIATSWSKPSSFVNYNLRTGSDSFKKKFYGMCVNKSTEFANKVKYFRLVNHNKLVQDKTYINSIAFWLGLDYFDYNLSEVGFDKNIKDLLNKENF